VSPDSRNTMAWRVGQDTRRAEVRESLIDAVLEVLAERGSFGLTDTTVAQRAGHTRVTLERRFGTVERLLAVAWAERWPRQRARLRGPLTNGDLDPIDRVRFFVLEFAGLLRTDPRAATFARLAFLSGELHDPLALQVSAWRREWRRDVEAALEADSGQGHAIVPHAAQAWVEIIVRGLVACATSVSTTAEN